MKPRSSHSRSRHPSRPRSQETPAPAALPRPGIGALLGERFAWRAGLLTALALLASGLTFDPKLYINGDNVDYILLAERLIEDGVWWGSRKFPPFFPILLAPVQLIFGTPWLPQKLLVFALYLASAPLLLKIAERLLPRPLAFAGALLGLLAIPVLEFSHYVMSEIPFLLLTLAALVVGERLIRPRGAPATLAIFVLLAAAAFYTRSIGAALVAALLLVLLLRGRWRWGLLALGLAVVTLVPWLLHSYATGNEGTTYLQQVIYKNPYYPEYGKLDGAALLARVQRNAGQYLLREIPVEIIPTVYHSTYTMGPAARGAALPLAGALAVLALAATGALAALRRATLLVAYMGISLLVALLWPPIWASVRFVLPILPLLILLFLRGCDLAVRGLPRLWAHIFVLRRRGRSEPESTILKEISGLGRARGLALGLLVGALLALGSYNVYRYHRETRAYPPVWASYFKAADWARSHFPRGSLVCDRKPNIFGLVTGLPSCSFPRERDPEKMLSFLRERGVRYVHVAMIPYDDLPRILYPFLADRSHYFDVVWMENPDGNGSFFVEFFPEGGREGFILEHTPAP